MKTLNKKAFFLKLGMTIVVIAVTYLRQPEMLIEPRFWAEEGTDYFSFAYAHDWVTNLFSPQFGYNTLYNSIATSLAASLPLEYAPFVTTYLAFLVQVSVSAFVIWGDIPLLDSLVKKFIVALSIQLLAYARIWVTTIGVQYWLCILTFLILISNHTLQGRKINVFQSLTLIVTGLTGVLSCFMIPAFIIKAVKTRSRQVVANTAVLASCLIVQGGIFTYALINRDPRISQRMVYCDPVYMLSKLVKFEFSVPFFGQFLFELPPLVEFDWLSRHLLAKVFPAIYDYRFDLLQMILGLFVLVYLILIICKRIARLDILVSCVALALVTIFSTLFSLNMSGGPRYTFAPSIMIVILVVSVFGDKTVPRLLRYVAVALTVFSVSISSVEYRPLMMDFAYSPSWPKWRDELEIWRNHPQYPVRIWPPPWEMKLQK